jgi:hypothetical protein
MQITITGIALFLMTFIVGGIFFEAARAKQWAKGTAWLAILSVFLTRQLDLGLSPLAHSLLVVSEFGLLITALSFHLLYRGRARRLG